MQDGASVHTSASTQAWLKANKVNQLAGGNWPAMSPDLNPTEHLWPLVNRHLVGSVFNTKDELYEALEMAFKQIRKEDVQAITGNMARRLSAVIVAHGGHTKY